MSAPPATSSGNGASHPSLPSLDHRRHRVQLPQFPNGILSQSNSSSTVPVVSKGDETTLPTSQRVTPPDPARLMMGGSVVSSTTVLAARQGPGSPGVTISAPRPGIPLSATPKPPIPMTPINQPPVDTSRTPPPSTPPTIQSVGGRPPTGSTTPPRITSPLRQLPPPGMSARGDMLLPASNSSSLPGNLPMGRQPSVDVGEPGRPASTGARSPTAQVPRVPLVDVRPIGTLHAATPPPVQAPIQAPMPVFAPQPMYAPPVPSVARSAFVPIQGPIYAQPTPMPAYGHPAQMVPVPQPVPMYGQPVQGGPSQPIYSSTAPMPMHSLPPQVNLVPGYEPMQMGVPVMPAQQTRPNYQAMTGEEQVRMRAEFAAKFRILASSFPAWKVEDPPPATTLDRIHDLYAGYVKQIITSLNCNQWKIYLIIFFLILEAAAIKFLGLDCRGFTQSQCKIINRYDQVLVELGEKYYLNGPSNWPVELRIMIMGGFHVVIFLMVKYISKWVGGESMVSNIQGVVDQLLGGGPMFVNQMPIDAQGIPVPPLPGVAVPAAAAGGGAVGPVPNPGPILGGIGSMFSGLMNGQGLQGMDLGATIAGLGSAFTAQMNPNAAAPTSGGCGTQSGPPCRQPQFGD